MKHSDFRIGLEFQAQAGYRWRCTDVGTRTILAIRLTGRDPMWHAGPPYIATEVVFDELAMESCHLTDADAIRAAVHERDASCHPGYSTSSVSVMLEAKSADTACRYPNPGVLRYDRRRVDGEILHPYAARKEGHGWVVLVLLPFLDEFGEMPESEFILLPMASTADVRARAVRA